MNTNNKLALIIAYYLSRFDRDAWKSLGYSSFADATQKIGKILEIKPTTIKNMRDEFDPYHENARAGWHQRELRGSRQKTMQALQDLDQHSLYEIVIEIIKNPDFRQSAENEDLLSIFSDRKDKPNREQFVFRGRTGIKAEEFFMDYFSKFGKPYPGTLIDRRQDGGGYDFEIKSNEGIYYVEVKGLTGSDGGILFTDKEWTTAKAKKERYILILVSELGGEPVVKTIENPASIFSPVKNIYPAIRIDWPVSSRAIQGYLRSLESRGSNIL